MIDASQFNPTERRLVASFPAGLASSLRSDRNSRERRAKELVRDLSTLRRECVASGGVGMTGGFAARFEGAIARFDPLKIQGCVLDLDFDNSALITTANAALTNANDLSLWTLTGVTITNNDTAAPDSTTTATKYTSTASPNSAVGAVSTVSSTSVMVPMTVTFYAKYSNRQWLLYQSRNATGSRTYFDIQNGALGTVGASHSNASIVSVGNGWYKCQTTVIADAGTPGFQFWLTSANAAITQASGDVCWLWGCSVDQPRASAIINRASGVSWTQSTVNNQPGYAAASSLYNQRRIGGFYGGQFFSSTEAAVVAAYTDVNASTSFCTHKLNNADTTAGIFGASKSSDTNGLRIVYQFTTGAGTYVWQTQISVGGTAIAKESAGGATSTSPAILEIVDTGSTLAMILNGSTLVAASAYTNGTTDPTRYAFGCLSRATNGSFLSGTIASCVTHSRALTTTERSYVRVGLGNRFAIAVTP